MPFCGLLISIINARYLANFTLYVHRPDGGHSVVKMELRPKPKMDFFITADSAFYLCLPRLTLAAQTFAVSAVGRESSRLFEAKFSRIARWLQA